MSPIVSLSFEDFNYVFHALRSAEFRSINGSGCTVASVGCAGRWYFDWINECLNHPKTHLGVEFFNEKPESLPENAVWITNTASDLSGIGAESVDIVISGQNIEHLLPDEIDKFILEAWRVLKPGGRFVMDSPNRLVTAALKWIHPEHFVEFTPDEIREVLELSGFSADVRGVWLCRDNDGEWLPLSPRDEKDFLWRAVTAARFPDESFSWWVEARKTEHAPQVQALQSRMEEIARNALTERKQRLWLTQVGTEKATALGTVFAADKGSAGYVIYGPYLPLPAGSYRFSMRVGFEHVPAEDSVLAIVDIVSAQGTCQHYRKELTRSDAVGDANGYVTIEGELSLDNIAFGCEVRVYSTGIAAVSVIKDVDISSSGKIW